ncbi:MAG TPA: CcmD family protein [Candidatus Acidoferrales bacterium]|nr:CcmD family protein [Candidatus Acidoferrales bacterium]
MPIGLKHFFYAYSLVWFLLFGYLLNLGLRQKRLSEELRALRDRLTRKAAD